MSPRAPLRLSSADCDRCGRCVAQCAPKALRIGPGYILVDWEKCTGCGKCTVVCETGAISLREALTAAVGATEADRSRGGVFPIEPARTVVTPVDRAIVSPEKAPQAMPTGPSPAWTLAEAALVLVIAFALLIGAGALRSLISDAAWGASIGHIASTVGLAGLAWYLARRKGMRVLQAFRLDAGPEVRNALLAVAVALGCRVFSMAYASIVPPPSVQTPDVLTGMFGGGALGIALTFVVVALLSPVIEEVLLRGVVFGALQRRIGTWGAIVASAAIFAVMHLDLWSLVPFMVLGIGLGWLASRGRSLWPAILAHVLYNSAILAATFFFYAAGH